MATKIDVERSEDSALKLLELFLGAGCVAEKVGAKTKKQKSNMPSCVAQAAQQREILFELDPLESLFWPIDRPRRPVTLIILRQAPLLLLLEDE